MRIRRAGPSDAGGIARVHVSAWQTAYRGLLPDDLLDSLSVEDSARRWQERLLTGSWGQFLVLEWEDRIVGFASCGPTRDEDLVPLEVGEIYVIYVAPREWRKGYGRALLVEALGLLRQAGNREVALWVLHDNRAARSFYEAMGFEADGTTRTKTRSDGTALKVVRYRRTLPSRPLPARGDEQAP
jgi:ribosomal protein S18 acetylase RimI-like enzyme